MFLRYIEVVNSTVLTQPELREIRANSSPTFHRTFLRIYQYNLAEPIPL